MRRLPYPARQHRRGGPIRAQVAHGVRPRDRWHGPHLQRDDDDQTRAAAVRLFRRAEWGQAVVEFALLLPPLMLILVFGMVEMGSALSHNMTIAASTREGARMGSNLANGGGALGCGGGQSPNGSTVAPRVSS